VILIDACNVASGGGVVLLRYLFDVLSDNAPCHFIVRNEAGIQGNHVTTVPKCSPVGRWRDQLISRAIDRLSAETLLCFGNVPPGRALNGVRVITYFHNPHMIRSIDQWRYGLKNRLRYFVLSRAFRKRIDFTSLIVCQTNFIRDSLCSYYAVSPNKTIVCPFFDHSAIQRACDEFDRLQPKSGFIYVSDGAQHKNHDRLLDAWELLAQRVPALPELKLTIGPNFGKLAKQIEAARARGVPITNIGAVSHQRALQETLASKATVFPSLVETLGLGLVEAVLLGCDVLASDRKYLHEVVVPSAVFDPENADDIASCVAGYVNCRQAAQPKVVLRNQMNEFVDLLTSR